MTKQALLYKGRGPFC